MDSRKRRTARSRSFSREKEDFSNLDIPIRRSETRRERDVREYRGQETDKQEERYRAVRRGKRKRKNPLKGVLFLFLLLVGIFFLWRFLSPYIGKQYRTIAIFGLDSRDGNKEAGALSDVIMLASINERSGAIERTHVLRDT